VGLIIIGPSGSSALCRSPPATLLRTNKVSLCRLYNKLRRSTAKNCSRSMQKDREFEYSGIVYDTDGGSSEAASIFLTPSSCSSGLPPKRSSSRHLVHHYRDTSEVVNWF
jgi:hypothetical protein